MAKRLSFVAVSLAVALSSAPAFAQTAPTPGDAKMKDAPSADAVSSQESPGMRGKTMHKKSMKRTKARRAPKAM